jgi:aminotransferase
MKEARMTTPATTGTTQAAAAPQGMQLVYALMAKANEFPDALFLARGDPDFDAPRSVVQPMVHNLEEERGEISPEDGLLDLRQVVAKSLAKKQIVADPQTEIVITNGAQESVFLAVGATLGSGDEIIYPEPNYGAYASACDFFDARRVVVPSSLEAHFAIHIERVVAALTPRTRAILFVSPNNPTGSVIDPESARALAQIAIDHDLVIISDEIYDQFLYDGASLTSPASLPGMAERTLTLNSISKTYAMTGIRVGWINGPAHLMRRVRQLKQAMSGPTSAIVQRGALAALDGPQDEARAMYDQLVIRRAMLMASMDRLGWRYCTPQGGQFMFMDIGSSGMTGLEMCEYLLNRAHVVVSPGTSFGSNLDRFLRITFLQPAEILAEGLERIERAVAELPTSRRVGA